MRWYVAQHPPVALAGPNNSSTIAAPINAPLAVNSTHYKTWAGPYVTDDCCAHTGQQRLSVSVQAFRVYSVEPRCHWVGLGKLGCCDSCRDTIPGAGTEMRCVRMRLEKKI
jgi:hypothetical protein